MNIPKIFIVDDEPQNFDVIETMLIDHGYHLFYAASGEDALQMIATIEPDIILLDVMMPGMDGIEVCRRLRADSDWQHLPIIIITALNRKEDLSHCLASGADDFISKPVNSTELSARVQSMLRIKQQYDQLQTFNTMQQQTIHLLNEALTTLRGNLTKTLPHEIRTPLNGIVGALTLLITDDESQRDPDDQEMLELAYESALRLERLSERFLNYVSLESDPRAGQSIASTSSRLIESVVNAKVMEYQRQADLDLWLQECDLNISMEHLTWLVQELVDNACKFSEPDTPITVRGQIDNGLLESQPDPPQFNFSVQDSGRGMTDKQISGIDAFVQFERKQYEQQGAGLGLAIVRKVVEQCKGDLDIFSTYKHTTKVQVTLPCNYSFTEKWE